MRVNKIIKRTNNLKQNMVLAGIMRRWFAAKTIQRFVRAIIERKRPAGTLPKPKKIVNTQGYLTKYVNERLDCYVEQVHALLCRIL